LGRLGGGVHAAGFDVWTALQPFQPRNFLTQRANSLFEGGHFIQQFDNQLLQLGRGQTVEGGGWIHG
jgi:hypothetical protein